MTAITTMLWELAGRPEVAGAKGKLLQPIPAVCCVSGEESAVTADADRALGASFTDRRMFHAGTDRVGQAALWVCSGKGNQTLRLWSIIAAPGENLPPSRDKAFLHRPGLWLGNRGDPQPIADILAAPPAGEWAVSIAVSGQKHVAPYATVNRGPGRWTVRMENTDITSTPEEWTRVRAAAMTARRIGVRGEDVHAARPGLLKTREQLDAWRDIEPILRPYRHSPLLNLALWMITKTTMEES